MAKKKILLLSDDLRTNSGVSTMSRELVMGTVHQYDWVQIGGNMNHPENGKIINYSEEIRKQTNVNDASVTIYPVSGYGNDDVLFSVIAKEAPHAIMHFTDPRYWTWLYAIEREIRKKMPLTYLNIWDDLPYPMWNRPFYESCDALFSISKQTYNINKWVLGPENCTTLQGNLDKNGNVEKTFTEFFAVKPNNRKTLIHYVPHGINSDVFKPLDNTNKELVEGKKRFFNGQSYNFNIFFNSRNVKRKQVSNIILAYRIFCDSLSTEEAKKVCLILHTEVVGQNGHGTDLPSVKEAMCKDYAVYFSQKKILPTDMNLMYNLADVTINVSSNEGFGLSVAESIMAGTPIIANVTGGLQDQIGQVDDNGNPVEFTKEFATNNIGKYKKHGIWAKPVWSNSIDTHGSNQTPYIFDDMVDPRNIAEAMMYWYLMSPEEREHRGLEGRRWALNEGGLNSKNMCQQLIDGLEFTLNNFVPIDRFSIHTSKEYVGQFQPDNCMGIDFGKVDIEKVKKEML